MPPESEAPSSAALPAGDGEADRRAGFWAAFAAYTAWGLMPVYWKAVAKVSPFEVLCHRVLWAAAFLSLVVSFQGGGAWGRVASAVRAPRALRWSALSGSVIGVNWLLYIWAVTSGHVLDASLGYYVNPLINVVVGCVFFAERLRRLQVVALVLAGVGVATLTFGFGHFPWVGLALASTFALYGALRKVARVDALAGQWFETVLLCAPATAYLLWLQRAGVGVIASGDVSMALLISTSGVVTSLPLIGFAFGIRRLRLSTVGILQYISPTLNFGLGVFLYREPFTRTHLAAFCCIWLGVAAYTAEALWAVKRLGLASPVPP